MNTTAKAVIGLLATAVIALGITLGVVIASDNGDGDGVTMMDRDGMMNGGDSFMGMMTSMGSGDSEQMLRHMRDILGEDGYERMMGHFQDHGEGMMTGDGALDGMMHRMMDGMMQHLSDDGGDALPPGTDAHHETPTP